MGDLAREVRGALRTLGRSPGLAAIAILTLAIGIGANTAIFSVVNAVLLKPLPFPEPDRLVRIYTEFPTMGFRDFWMSAPELVEIRRDAGAWSAIGGWVLSGVNLAGGEEPLRANAASATRGLLDALRAAPARGRLFTEEEDRSGGPQVALLSDGLWRRAFGAREDVVGATIRVDGAPATVVGVLPRAFRIPPGEAEAADLILPLQLDPANPGNRGGHYLSVIGRLAPGAGLEGARAEMSRLIAGWQGPLAGQHRLTEPNHPVVMRPLHEEVVGGARRAVLMLMGAVVFVLLIACVNVANLLLARAEARSREIAVRVALGAGLSHMLRLFLVEGVVLAGAGALLGAVAARWGLAALLRMAPGSLPRAEEVGIDGRVLAFTAVVAVIAALVFAAAPVVHAGVRDLASRLKAGGHRATSGVAGRRIRRALVIAEVALTVVLVTGSGLMIRTFWKIQEVKPGFRPEGLLTGLIDASTTAYPDPASVDAFRGRLEERLASLPGVAGVATASGLPPIRRLDANDTDIEGYQATPEGPAENVDFYQFVSVDFFRVMGIPLEEGRVFERADLAEGAAPAVVINRTMARRFWPKESPLGRRLRVGGPDDAPWMTIVGVVGDVKNAGVAEPAGTELFFLDAQARRAGASLRQMWIAVRTTGEPSGLAGALRAAVRAIDPALPLDRIRTMEEVVAGSVSRPRFLTLLMSIFSAAGLLLAAVGLFGVMSYSVAQRTQEIGVRSALGAARSDLFRLVLGEGMTLAVAGIALGAAGALALTRLLHGLLWGVATTDPATFGLVAAIQIAVAAAACLVPAARATRVDPLVALREE